MRGFVVCYYLTEKKLESENKKLLAEEIAGEQKFYFVQYDVYAMRNNICIRTLAGFRGSRGSRGSRGCVKLQWISNSRKIFFLTNFFLLGLYVLCTTPSNLEFSPLFSMSIGTQVSKSSKSRDFEILSQKNFFGISGLEIIPIYNLRFWVKFLGRKKLPNSKYFQCLSMSFKG